MRNGPTADYLRRERFPSLEKQSNACIIIKKHKVTVTILLKCIVHTKHYHGPVIIIINNLSKIYFGCFLFFQIFCIQNVIPFISYV